MHAFMFKACNIMSLPHHIMYLFWYCLLLSTFCLSFLTLFCAYFALPKQEYTEEFREIAGKSKKMGGSSVAEGNITLINQRHVGDDLPVINNPFF